MPYSVSMPQTFRIAMNATLVACSTGSAGRPSTSGFGALRPSVEP